MKIRQIIRDRIQNVSMEIKDNKFEIDVADPYGNLRETITFDMDKEEQKKALEQLAKDIDEFLESVDNKEKDKPSP
jgi:excinuclease UvrABC ATPase subunit